MTFAKKGHLISAAASAVLAVTAYSLHAQSNYPSKPIRMLVPFSAGSGTDIIARMLGQKFQESWGQQVVVDNRPSGGGIAATQTVVRSNPDGYTLLMVSAGHAASASLYAKLPYDVARDFAGISQVASASSVLVVSKDTGVKSVKELIALAKSKPGQISFGSAGIGSGSHISGEMFRLAADVDMIHVPYKGASEAINDVIGGRIQVFFPSSASAVTFVRDGRLLALAVSTKERSPLLPNVPTIAEAGIKAFEFDQWFGLLAPAKTPRSIVDQLSREVGHALTTPEVKERMLNLGLIPKASTPPEFDSFIRSEIEKLGKVIRASGAQIN